MKNINEEKSKLIDKKVLVEIMRKHFSDEDPDGEIHKELKLLIQNGYDRNDIKKKVEEYLSELRNQGNEAEEIMLNVMGFFDGWAHSDWQI